MCEPRACSLQVVGVRVLACETAAGMALEIAMRASCEDLNVCGFASVASEYSVTSICLCEYVPGYSEQMTYVLKCQVVLMILHTY